MAKSNAPSGGRRPRGSGWIKEPTPGHFQAGYPKKTESGHHVKRFTAREDAEGWLVEMKELDAEGYDIDGGQQILEKWLARWITLQETDLELDLKARTIEDYKNKLSYISGLLGKMHLLDIKPDHTDEALRKVRQKFAKNSADQIRNLFHRVMDEAVMRSYIVRNPVRKGTRRPKNRHQDMKRRATQRLPMEEAANVIYLAKKRKEALAWWIFFVLGLRRGEVLGLRRQDIDMAMCHLTVAQQYTELDGKAHLSTPKTDYSVRTLPFPRAMKPMFLELFAQLDERARLASKRGTWKDHQLLFPGKSGKPMNPTSLYHMLKRIVGQVEGVSSKTNVHHLRHSAASFYSNLMVPDNVRHAIAGHSPKDVTDYYGELGIETLRPWIEQVYDLLAAEVKKLEDGAVH